MDLDIKKKVEKYLGLVFGGVEAGYFDDSPKYPNGTPVAKVAYTLDNGMVIKQKGGKRKVYYRKNKQGNLVFSSEKNATFEQDVTIAPYDIIIPPRPFMRNAEQSELLNAAEILVDAMIDGAGEQAGLRKAGQHLQNAIKDEITSLDSPPNAPATVRKKGSSNPLIDTGFLRKNVKFKTYE